MEWISHLWQLAYKLYWNSPTATAFAAKPTKLGYKQSRREEEHVFRYDGCSTLKPCVISMDSALIPIPALSQGPDSWGFLICSDLVGRCTSRGLSKGFGKAVETGMKLVLLQQTAVTEMDSMAFSKNEKDVVKMDETKNYRKLYMMKLLCVAIYHLLYDTIAWWGASANTTSARAEWSFPKIMT